MLGNWPTMLAHQDFQARHSDMLAAARAGEIVDPNKPSTLTVEDFINSTEAIWARLLEVPFQFVPKPEWLGECFLIKSAIPQPSSPD